MDAERNGLARGLLASDALNMDLVLETVDAGDLALAALVAAANNLDFIILSTDQLAIGQNTKLTSLEETRRTIVDVPDGNAADVVLLAKLTAQGSAHDVAADGAGGLEVGASGLSAGRRDIGVGLHLDGCWGRVSRRW